MSCRTLVAVAALCVAAAYGPGFAQSNARRPIARPVSPLTVVLTPTPRFLVPRYDTSGSIPQVTGSGIDLRDVNTALREAVLQDQRAYAPHARASVKVAGRSCRGVYHVATDRGLLSASTVVVSALLPAQELYPCGNDGNGWVSVTVRVPSGKPVTLGQLFQDPFGGPYALGVGFFRAIAHDWRLSCVVPDLSRYQPTLHNYRDFALTPTGLALGFWQEPACNRIEAVIPYAALRPYLSPLGTGLIAGVREAR